MPTVYVGNLNPDATKDDLARIFDRYGRITDIWVAQKPPGFAFIDYEDDRDAQDAVQGEDGRNILDKRVRVEISRRGRQRGGGGGGGYDGGRGGGGGGGLQRTEFRATLSGLPRDADWRTVKDFLRDTVPPAFVDDIRDGECVCEFASMEDAQVRICVCLLRSCRWFRCFGFLAIDHYWLSL